MASQPVARVAPAGYLDRALAGVDLGREEQWVLAAMVAWLRDPAGPRPALARTVLSRRSTVDLGALPTAAGPVLDAVLPRLAADGFDVLVADLSGDAARLSSPARAVARRLGLVPEDRRRQGVALEVSVRENATLASLGGLTRFGLIDKQRERRQVSALIERLGVKTPGPETRLRDLSGGNQQKVVLAKWLSARSDVYLLDEPTVGVDVAAKVEIYRLLGELAAGGAAILVLSSDLLELQGLCDRILVMYRGRLVREFAAAETTADEILATVTTGRTDGAAREAA